MVRLRDREMEERRKKREMRFDWNKLHYSSLVSVCSCVSLHVCARVLVCVGVCPCVCVLVCVLVCDRWDICILINLTSYLSHCHSPDHTHTHTHMHAHTKRY